MSSPGFTPPFLQKKTVPPQEERLRKAREDAYIKATIQLARGNTNHEPKNFITREQMDAELKAIAKELFLLDC